MTHQSVQVLVRPVMHVLETLDHPAGDAGGVLLGQGEVPLFER